MKKILLIIIVLVVLSVGWIFLRNKRDVMVNTLTVSPMSLVSPKSTVNPSLVILKKIVTYTDSGYTPNTITIKKGETVTWKNESSVLMWTASSMHPAHAGYPGSGIGMCGTNTLVANFDSCKGYDPSESWEFTFDNVGMWGYHNHLKASNWGKIVVE